ncbi:MAG: hypothetical protein AB1633_06550, partial [Elusimicrobiota bacterium]
MIRKILKTLLLRVLIWVEKTPPQRAALVKRMSIWQREIHIPVYFIVVINLILILLSLIVEIGPSAIKLSGLIVFLGLVFYIFTKYIRNYVPEVITDNNAAMLLGIIACTSVLLIQIPKSINVISPYVIPLAGMVLLTSILLGRNAGVVMAIVLPLILGVIYDFSFEYFFYHSSGSFIAAYLSENINSRQDITTSGAKIALINIFSILIFSTLEYPYIRMMRLAVSEILWAASNGILASIIVLGLLP